MHRSVFRAGRLAVAMLVVIASASGWPIALAQNEPPADRATEPNPSPAALPANLPDQVRRAQVELKRLDCLAGRVDGKLGDKTRDAVKKFWASAKRPVVEVAITDELIAELAEHGDNFCRPPRRFFAIGGRGGTLPFFAPGGRPVAIPTPPPPAPPEEH